MIIKSSNLRRGQVELNSTQKQVGLGDGPYIAGLTRTCPRVGLRFWILKEAQPVNKHRNNAISFELLLQSGQVCNRARTYFRIVIITGSCSGICYHIILSSKTLQHQAV
jgi:hypothetical protein